MIFYKIVFVTALISSPLSKAQVSKQDTINSAAYRAGEKIHPSSNPLPLENLGIFKKDISYYQTPIFKNLHLIYSENIKNSVPSLSTQIKNIDIHLSSIFPNKPYFKRNSIIFISPHTQIFDAFASVFPLSNVVLFPSKGVYLMVDQRSLYPTDILIHEMTHTYQFSQNPLMDRKLWWILGPLSLRNNFMPLFILEGFAVLNESIYGKGGRLFNGLERALTFSQLKAGISLKRVLKFYNHYFSNREKYVHGGYFFAYLHSQYGMKALGHLFSESAKTFPIAFPGLNKTFKKSFGKDFQDLFKNYKDHYATLAKNQQSSPEPSLFSSHMNLPINSDQNTIYLLTSDIKSPVDLILLDKRSKKIHKQKTNLPLGKVFYRNGKYHSSASGQTRGMSVEYSLFDENLRPIQQYNSQQIMDFYKDKYIAIDTRQSYPEISLLVNGTFYDTTYSSAIMDHEGQIYYFKQKKEIRTLYRDKVPIFSFKSYYSYPVEADSEGIYFIGATRYGSSLFVYKEGEGIFRLSPSDTIGYARKIKEHQFLVSEITPTKYEYKIIQTKEFSEQPVLYTYSFQKQNIFENRMATEDIIKSEESEIFPENQEDEELDFYLDNFMGSLLEKETKFEHKELFVEDSPSINNPSSIVKETFAPTQKPNQKLKHKAYNSLQMISLKNISFLFFLRRPYYNTKSQMSWQDPLKFSQLKINTSIGSKQYFSSKLLYSYNKYRPSFNMAISYDQELIKGSHNSTQVKFFTDINLLDKKDFRTPEDIKKFSGVHRDRAIEIGFKYPLIIKNHWNLSWLQNVKWGQKQLNQNPIYESQHLPVLWFASQPWKNYIKSSGGITFNFERKYKYAYYFYKKRALKLLYDLLSLKTEPKKYKVFLLGKAQAYFTEEVGNNWYLTLNGIVKKNLLEKNRFLNQRQSLPLGIEEDYRRISNWRSSFYDLYGVSFQILKAFNSYFYPLKLPLSVRQFAPLFGLSFVALQLQKDYKTSHLHYFLIPSIGFESELQLITDQNFWKFGISVGYILDITDISQPPSPLDPLNFKASFWIKKSF